MPSLLVSSAVFLGGLALLAKGSDLFVDSAANIAKILGISEFIIGLTLIAVGTSLPELGSGIVASYSGNTEIVLGNVLGSNIANIALILGFSAAITPIITQKEMFYRDGIMLMAASLAFYYMASDGVVSALEGILLLALFLAYNLILLEFRPKIPHFREYVDYLYELNSIAEIEEKAQLFEEAGEVKTHAKILNIPLKGLRKMMRAGKRVGRFHAKILDAEGRREYRTRLSAQRERLKKLREYRKLLREKAVNDIGMLFVSGAAIYVGAEFFVGSALDIAGILGIGPSLVGLTIVSVGTSLPELAVSLQSARKGFSEMVIGNVLGSNIANITLVVGLCSLVAPISLGVTPEIQATNIGLIIPFMLFVSFTAFVAIRSNWSIRRFEGFFFLLLYVIFLYALGIAMDVL